MPIKGLSEVKRFPRAGKIRLGDKRVSERTGKEYPAAVDYFVWPEEYTGVLTELFGEKAREIDIMFPVDDRELVAPQWYKRYGSSTGLVCRGDGEVAVCRMEDGSMEEIECPGRDCEWYQVGHCRQIMNLQFLIPQLASEGLFQIDTSSVNSIISFNSCWDYVRCLTGGKIAMIPLKLRLVPKEVSPGGRKKVVYVLEFRLAECMSLDQLRALASGTEPARAALPEPETEDEIEYFYPQEVRPADEVPPDAGEAEFDELDSRIADLEAALGLTRAQSALRWRKAGGDKAAMLKLLEEEYARRARGERHDPPPLVSPSEPRDVPEPEAAPPRAAQINLL